MGKRNKWKAALAGSAAAALIAATGCTNGGASVDVTDYTFDTAGNMFAYAEFELSGEPLAETLGLDLDVLDAGAIDKPSKFDYVAGIESYEYSEEAMYEVVEKSGLGLHLVNGPATRKQAQTSGAKANEALAAQFVKLAEAVGYKPEEIHQNMFPTFIEFAKGDPHYLKPIDTAKFAEGEDGAYIPKYQVDFSSLRWDRAKMDKTLVPAAYGGTFLKQALWAGDFLGNYHTVDKDEELEGKTSSDDKDKNIRLGVSSTDGMQGMILAAEIWNKLLYVRDGLFYDAKSKQLTAGQGGGYNPQNGFVYLPHAVKVTESASEGEFYGPQKLEVSDARSLLQDQWLMLWPAAEFLGTTDQRAANTHTNPAFRAAFDGTPFPAAPAANTDANPANDVRADDPYSVNYDVLMQLFRNVKAMHWNEAEGVFVTENDGAKQGDKMDTFEAGYTLEALRIFERAIDGLPVGYANGEDAEGLNTAEGKEALAMIRKQADTIADKMIDAKGLAANGWTVGKGLDGSAPTLKAQLGAIRGLTAAYLATKDEKYRDAARKVYQATDDRFWDAKAKAYKTSGDSLAKTYVYDAFTAGGVSAMLRLGLTTLANADADKSKPKALDVSMAKKRYTDFYRQVVNGPELGHGMQASEFWDTGDVYKEGDKKGNTDKDTVPQPQAGHGTNGIAPVLLSVEVKPK
ncbi:hypothetical protein [Paenibacillus cymbidii]|uniref:hypothetical protein n=1 Tax=Paenibacillus cymbidii TaxID=1639034 RepID=UPI0010814BFE|nr:hypothetical protein [Paenibacillus cymbidii]